VNVQQEIFQHAKMFCQEKENHFHIGKNINSDNLTFDYST